MGLLVIWLNTSTKKPDNCGKKQGPQCLFLICDITATDYNVFYMDLMGQTNRKQETIVKWKKIEGFFIILILQIQI